jgi:flagellar motor switch protein FliG
MNPSKLAGSLKVAILMSAVGSEAANKLLNKFSVADKTLIIKLQSQLGRVPSELVEKVAQEFVAKASKAGSNEPKQLAGMKSGPAEDTSSKSGPESKTSNPVLKAIHTLKSDQLAQLLRDEHPQTTALVIVHLKPEAASEVLSKLPDEIKADVAFRIANLDKVQSGMVEEIDNVFQDILKNQAQTTTQEAGGVSRLAEILNQIDGNTAEQIIDEIEELNPELADEIRQNMFVFEDIVLVDNKGLQQVLRNVESRELALALKAASDAVKERIFKNMSERAAEILKDEMEVSGAVRMKDVTDAQQKITRIIQEMERKGELIISGRGGEEFIG